MITGVLLAAGKSQRFGSHKLVSVSQNKLSLIQQCYRNLNEVVDNCIIVIRPDDILIHSNLAGEEFQFVECLQSENGMGYSIACGVRASKESDAWIIALADMPLIKISTYKSVVTSLKRGSRICAPYYQDQQGHPVGFDKTLYLKLIDLKYDHGAKAVIENNCHRLDKIIVDDPGIHIDIDTLQDAHHWNFNVHHMR